MYLLYKIGIVNFSKIEGQADERTDQNYKTGKICLLYLF